MDLKEEKHEIISRMFTGGWDAITPQQGKPALTKSHKFIEHAEENDLYSVNPCPPYTVLNKYEPFMSDDEGFVYWIAGDVEFNKDWVQHKKNGILCT